MKTLLKKLLIICLAMLSIVSCKNDDAIFKGELYEKIIYLLSVDDNTYSVVHSLDSVESSGSISVCYGGTMHIEKNVSVELETDSLLLKKYNYANFDTATTKYAKLLPPDKYKIETLKTVLKTTDLNPYSLIFIKVYPDGLSPDSSYMIPLRIKSVSDYKVNSEKNSVLYRVYISNKYAETKEPTYYSMSGSRIEDGGLEISISSTKAVQPLSKNTIRMFVSTQAYTSKLSEINKYAIKISINPQSNAITFSPYGSIEVEGVDKDQYNRFFEESGFQKIWISYRYRLLGSTAWTTVQERLKREIPTK